MRAHPPLQRTPRQMVGCSTCNSVDRGLWRAIGASVVAGGSVMALVLYAAYKYLTYVA